MMDWQYVQMVTRECCNVDVTIMYIGPHVYSIFTHEGLGFVTVNCNGCIRWCHYRSFRFISSLPPIIRPTASAGSKLEFSWFMFYKRRLTKNILTRVALRGVGGWHSPHSGPPKDKMVGPKGEYSQTRAWRCILFFTGWGEGESESQGPLVDQSAFLKDWDGRQHFWRSSP